MSVETEHPKTDGGDPPPSGGGAADPPEGAWESVPTGGEEDSVEVQWSDLHAMRGRIEELEGEVAELQGEVDRLEAEMDALRRQHEAAIDRYEELLAERAGGTDHVEAGGERGILARVRRWLGL